MSSDKYIVLSFINKYKGIDRLLCNCKTITFTDMIVIRSRLYNRIRFMESELGINRDIRPKKFSFKEMKRFISIDE